MGNRNGLRKAFVDEVFEGAKNDIDSPAVESIAGRTISKSMTEGFMDIEPTAMTLASAPDEGLPEGAMPKKLQRAYDNTPYQMLKFMGITDIPFAEANDYSQRRNEDLSAREMKRCLRTSYLKADLHLAATLGYDNANDTVLAQANSNNIAADVVGGTVDGAATSGFSFSGTAWTAASAVPLQDIKTVIREVIPGADYGVFGRGVLDELGQKDEFTGRDLQFSGGSVNRDRVLEIIVQETDLEEAVSFERFYNVNQEGQTVDKKHVFKYGVWIGYGRDLVWIPLAQENPRSLLEKHELAEYDDIGSVMRGLCKRPVRDLGVRLDVGY